MEEISLANPIDLVAKQVKTFPLGIEQAFDNLASTLPNGMSRAYYGISWMEDGKVIYYAAAEQNGKAEHQEFALEPWTIESGKYIAVTVLDWHKKIDSIKDVFHNLMEDTRTDKTKPYVEWYKSDDEMICMMKVASN
jgi:hypothetical protein